MDRSLVKRSLTLLREQRAEPPFIGVFSPETYDSGAYGSLPPHVVVDRDDDQVVVEFNGT